ncbi:TPA: hypothetical protein ACSCYS_003440 [Aeromonas veronii]
MPTLYHGTSKIFEQFSPSFLKTGEGVNKYLPAFYLTSSMDLASGYAVSGEQKFAFNNDGLVYPDESAAVKNARYYQGVVMEVMTNSDDRIIDGDENISYDSINTTLFAYLNKKGELEKVDELIEVLLEDEALSPYIDASEFTEFFEKVVLCNQPSLGMALEKEFLAQKCQEFADFAEEDEVEFDQESFVSKFTAITNACRELKRQCFTMTELGDNPSETWMSVINNFFSKELSAGPDIFMKAMSSIRVDGVYLSDIAPLTNVSVRGDCYMYFNHKALTVKGVLEPSFGQISTPKKHSDFDNGPSF